MCPGRGARSSVRAAAASDQAPRWFPDASRTRSACRPRPCRAAGSRWRPTCPGAEAPRSSGSRCTSGGCTLCVPGWSGARAPWPATESRSARRSPRSSARSLAPRCGPARTRESRSAAWSGAFLFSSSTWRPNRARTTIPEDRPKDKMPVSLEQILITARGRLPALAADRALLERAASEAPRPPAFSTALRRPHVAVIAEVKRRSPSAGTIREDLDPADRAERYARHGAAAISVLTDTEFFGGSLDDLRAAVSRTAVPVLRKDFILDELQVLEARAAGAAAVLLIVRALGASRLT